MKRISALMIMILLLTLACSEVLLANSIDSNNYQNDEPSIAKVTLIAESAKISDIGMTTARDALVRAFDENLTEADIARETTEAILNSGSSEYIEAFPVMVCSGEDSALPHGDPSNDETNQILPGEVVVVDLGARYMGYCSDLTRTFFMGDPTDEMLEIYGIVQEAQVAGINAVRSGAMARAVDKAARDIIEGYGYGENFTHGLGHGVGVNVHQPPTLSPNSNEVLIHGHDMVVTIEPGIYIEGRFGVRIEDDVAVERTGHQVLTHSLKDLEYAILYPEGYVNVSENETGGFHQIIQGGIWEVLPYLLIPIILITIGIVYIYNKRKRDRM